MPSRLACCRVPLVVCVLLFADSPFAAAAQRQAPAAEQPAAAARPTAPQVVLNEQDSRETRNDFEALLKRFPPSVGQVMRIDPSLMRNEAYLAPYPAIAAFLQQHPDIVQNPNYYLEHVNYEMWNPRQPEDARAASIRAFQEMMQAIAVLLGLGAAAFVIVWIISTLVNYRRWYRTSKVQTEVHTKLLDRFSSNEDLMAYMQTPGRPPLPGIGADSARRPLPRGWCPAVADPVVAPGRCRPGGRLARRPVRQQSRGRGDCPAAVRHRRAGPRFRCRLHRLGRCVVCAVEAPGTA